MKKLSPFLIFILLSEILSFFSCNKTPTSPEPPKIISLPVINEFSANPSTIAKGQGSQLKWSVSNATTASIDQGIGNVSLTGYEYVYPEKTTTYTLTATNKDGSKTESCTITVKSAKLAIDGKIEKDYLYGCPVFKGWVKNVGDNTAWNASITIYCYSDKDKTVLIDTAWDYLADGNDIDPGVKVPFEAVCWELSSHSQIKSRKVVLDWLEKELSELTKEDFEKIAFNKRLWIENQRRKSKAIRR